MNFQLLVEELLSEAAKCTGPTKKTSSDRKGKKYMQCVKNPNGKGYKRVHFGQKGVKVTGFKRGSNSKAVTGVETDKGIIECEQVVVGAGPWVRDFWNMLELPKVANIKGDDGKFHEAEMWKYWMLQEGVIGVDKDFLRMNDGGQPPVMHVDSTAPLYSDSTKKLIPGFEGKEWISTKNKEANYTVGTRYLPDAYPLNNSSNFDKGYELKFLSSAENSNLRQLYFMPIIGWNNTNKTMLGLALHNIGVPNKKFEYLFMPMQSIAGKSQNNMAEFLLGSAEMNYRIFPKNTFRQILIRTAYQSYGLPAAGRFTSSGFTTWKNSVNFKIEPKKPNGSLSQEFSLSSIYAAESISGIIGSEVIGFEAENHFLVGEYIIKNDKTINEILGN